MVTVPNDQTTSRTFWTRRRISLSDHVSFVKDTFWRLGPDGWRIEHSVGWDEYEPGYTLAILAADSGSTDTVWHDNSSATLANTMRGKLKCWLERIGSGYLSQKFQ